MKNKIILVFLFSLLVPIHFSSAVYTPSIGSQSNPLYIQVQPDPVQSYFDAWSKLRSRPNVPACAYIDKTIDSQSALTVNMADPFSVKSETNYLNYLYSSYLSCVSRTAQTQSQQYVPSTSTTTGNVLDGVCQKSSGVNSYYSGETDVNKGGGMGGCSCKAGYQFEHGNYGQCLTIPTKTNDQVCIDKFGPHIKWDGTKTPEGLINCGCEAGYQANSDGKTCVPTSNIGGLPLGCTSTQGFNAIDGTPCGSTIKPVETNYQIPASGGSGPAPVQKVEVKAKPQKEVVETEKAPGEVKENIATNTEEIKPESFWGRLKAWLGF